MEVPRKYVYERISNYIHGVSFAQSTHACIYGRSDETVLTSVSGSLWIEVHIGFGSGLDGRAHVGG